MCKYIYNVNLNFRNGINYVVEWQLWGTVLEYNKDLNAKLQFLIALENTKHRHNILHKK
jgi:hypothetical protein